MKFIVDDDVVLSRPSEDPLSEHLAGFARWAREEGYAFPSRRRKVLLAACFSRWLGQQAVSARLVSSEHLARYLRSRARHVQVQRDDAGTLRQFLDFMRRQRVVPAEKIPAPRLTAVEQAVQEFERYLHDERRLAEVTVEYYVPFVREFLANRFGDGPVRFSRLCAGDVVRFVQCQAPRLHVKRTTVRQPVPIRFLTANWHANIQTGCSVRKKTFVLQNPLQIAEIRVDMPNSVSYRIAKDREKGSPNAHTIIRTGFKES